MFGKRKTEVLVVGAGPVGLFAALSLARRGVRVEIVDKEWRTGAHSYALALHPQTLRMLKEVGLASRLLEDAYSIRTLAFYDGATRKAEFRLPEGKEIGSVAVLRQDVLEGLLENALGDLGVHVLWNHQVSEIEPKPDGVAVRIDELEKESVGYAVAHTEWVVAKTTELETSLVIGADGHRSTVRRALGIDYQEAGPAQHFAVFEFRTDINLKHEMCICLNDQTTEALWPLPGGYCRWSFQLPDLVASRGSRMKDRIAVQLGGAQFPVLSEEHLLALIAQRAPWFSGQVQEIVWRIAVRFERRLASAWGNGRIWLAGDAAHMTGPIGVQSMNVGLREAADLTAVMADVVQGQKPVDQIEPYGARWTAEWRQLLGLDGQVSPQEKADPWIGQRADRLLACLPASGPDLVGLLGQLRLALS
jgi:2-polyprenyl-6-methoxyphenol hydroxylase-like FAD-dependent oxidoreductase